MPTVILGGGSADAPGGRMSNTRLYVLRDGSYLVIPLKWVVTLSPGESQGGDVDDEILRLQGLIKKLEMLKFQAEAAK